MFHIKVNDYIRGIEENTIYEELKCNVSPTVGPKASFETVSSLLQYIVDSNPAFGGVDLLFEYKPPLFPGYCDLVIIGKKEQTPCAYMIELKDWKKRRCIPHKKAGWIKFNGDVVRHPSAQIEDYVTACRKTHEAVVNADENKPVVKGSVYFTSLSTEDLITYMQKPNEKLTTEYPVFNQEANQGLAADITAYISSPDDVFCGKFMEGTYTQSYDLKVWVEHALDQFMQDGETEKPFVLVNEQNTAYTQIVEALADALKDTSAPKKVFVVKGMPGSGKTAVAANLLLEALSMQNKAKQQGNILFTTSSTNQQTWKKTFIGTKNILVSTGDFNPGINGSNVKRIIRQYQQHGFGNLIFNDNGTDRFKTALWRDIFGVLRDEKIQGLKSKTLPNMHTHIIVDEAHSLIKTYDEEKQQIIPYGSKGNWFEKVGPQAYHIIYASKISVFLMEDAQGFQDRESTRVADIEKWAKELGAEYSCFELKEQFRCGGSAEYIEWIDKLFTNSPVKNHASWKEKFDFQIMDNPSEMEEVVRRHHIDEHATVRLISSYSVEWKTKGKSPSTKRGLEQKDKDFYLQNDDGTYFSKCWNTPGEFVSPETNDTMLEDPLCEVGYPQEIRGWDFAYFGLLWLDDVVWRKDKWKINLEHISFDRGIASQRRAVSTQIPSSCSYIHEGMSEEINRLCSSMFHIYRVLLTRGIRGNVLYVKDQETRDYLRDLLQIEEKIDGCKS